MSHQEPWFVAEGLSKRYGGVQAVREARVSMRAGEVRGLIGANGAGKSTFMKMLTGQARPDSGDVLIDGIAIDLTGRGAGRRAGVELMPQELAILPNLTVAENVVLGREPLRGGAFLHRAHQDELALRAMAKVGLESVALDAPAGTLGLVQQRLLMAARAVMSGSRLVILDEPTAAMSPAEVGLLLEMVKALSRAGVACLYVSHRLDEIIELADAVTAMRDGAVIAELEKPEITHARLVELITTTPLDAPPPQPRVVSDTDDAVLELRNVSGHDLVDVSIRVAPGEIVGLAGLITSGADELLKIVAGSERPTGGEMRLAGSVLAGGKRRLAARAGVGYLPGDRTLAVLPNHRVRENVTVASLGEYSRLGMPGVARERHGITDALRRVGFTRSTEVTISTLSGGNQQKALFARWALERLKVLLLDDPTIGVDVGARAEIHAELREVAASGVGVLLYSSDIDELVSLSDRVLIFDRGRCVSELHQPNVTGDEVIRQMTGAASLAG